MEESEKAVILPAKIVSGLKTIVNALSDSAILRYIEDHPSLQAGGFKAKKSNVPHFKDKIKSKITTSFDLDGPLAELLSSEDLAFSVFPILSDWAIELFLPVLLDHFGEERLLANMALDSRDVVRELAITYASKESLRIVSDDELSELYRTVRSGIMLLVQDFRPILLRESGEPAQAREEEPRTELRIDWEKKFKQEHQALEQMKKDFEKERQKSEHLESKVSKLEMSNSELSKRLADTGALLTKREHDLKTTTEEMERMITEEVRERLTAEEFRWLSGAIDVERRIQVIEENGGLLQRTRGLLDRQQELDRHYGNRSKLMQTLESYQSTLDHVLDAQINSIRPLPDLIPLGAELQSRIRDLKRFLNMEEQHGLSVVHLKAKINQAESERVLDDLEAFINRLDGFSLLSAGEIEDLYETCQTKRGQILATADMESQLQKISESTNPAWVLRRSLQYNQPFWLLVDGHNLLYKLSDVFSPYYDAGRPQRAARDRLVELIGKGFRESTKCMATIYFDGPVANEEHPLPNVSVHYSGGTGKHRADKVILADVRSSRKDSKQRCCVVTEEWHDFGEELVALKVMQMHPEQFFSLLRQWNAQTVYENNTSL